MTIFILAPIACQEYAEKVGESLFVGAASKKVVGLAKAIQAADAKVAALCCAISTSSEHALLPGMILNLDGVEIMQLPSLKWRGLNRIWASTQYVLQLIKRFKQGDRVLYYNSFVEYLPAAAYVRIRYGRDCQFIDVEDAPPDNERGLRGLAAKNGLRLLRKLCNKSMLVAATSIAKTLNIDSYLAINGISTVSDLQRPPEWVQPIKVLMGGSLTQATGLNLYCEAVEIFGHSFPSKLDEILFIVTGQGEEQFIANFATRVRCNNVKITVAQNITAGEYYEILRSCQVGLQLKVPDGVYADTTFPSKAIEYATHGLLLVSTKVSDIHETFDSDSALILDQCTPETLAAAFADIIDSSSIYRKKAENGCEIAKRNFGRTSVGLKVRNFLKI